MSRTIHLCSSVRGMLRWDKRTTKRNLRGITRGDGTRYASVEEFRDALLDMLAAGNEVIPVGDCSDFDPKTGCRGHQGKEAP